MTIVEYDWDWGDGTTTTSTNPTNAHNYPTSGQYTITLTVTDDAGLTDSLSKTIIVAPTDIGKLGLGSLGTSALGETPVATVGSSQLIDQTVYVNVAETIVPSETDDGEITPIGGFAFFTAQTSTSSSGAAGRTGISSVSVEDSITTVDLTFTGINDASGSNTGGINEIDFEVTGISAAVLSSDGIHDLRFD